MAGANNAHSGVPTGSHYLSRWAREVEAARPDPVIDPQRPRQYYDFAAMSPANMVQAANMFYRTGKISLSDLGRLILMPTAAARPSSGRFTYDPAIMMHGESAIVPRNYLADLAEQIVTLERLGGLEAEVVASRALLHKLRSLQADQALLEAA